VIARRDGLVEGVDATRVVVRALQEDEDERSLASGVDTYKLTKFQRTNQNTCFNQKPIVQPVSSCGRGRSLPTSGHRKRRTGTGPERYRGLHELGRLQLRGLDPGERAVVKDDVFSSIHIEEFELIARDTKLGKEEVTRDIPTSARKPSRTWTRAASSVSAPRSSRATIWWQGDPKGETQLTPEEKLLRLSSAKRRAT